MKTDGLTRKLDDLRASLRRMPGLVIAFSGGVDSTLLAAVARQVLGGRALAVTAVSPTFSSRERRAAAALARRLRLRHVFIRSNELQDRRFARNPENRCYFCKRELFEKLTELARRRGLRLVADGTNLDDLKDQRPGRKAARELGVVSPLLDAGFTKADIRRASRALKLPTADKPAMACLASRFPYGGLITSQGLESVERVEEGLRRMGFKQVRARHHGALVRIEVAADEIRKLCRPAVRRAVVELAKKIGFVYISADLEGYRTGSMNATTRNQGRSNYAQR